LVLKLAIFAAEPFDFDLKLLGPLDRPPMLGLPIPDLLPKLGILPPEDDNFLAQVEILAPEVGNFVAQINNFAAKLSYELKQLRPPGGRWGDKRVFHDDNACTANLPEHHRALGPRKRVGRSSTAKSTYL
jgi:hypothetical protein